MAKPGPNMLDKVSQELNYNPQKINAFQDLFEETFFNTMDDNTVVDIDGEYFILYHSNYPEVKFKGYKIHERDSMVHSMIGACPEELSIAEYKLYRRIIADYITSGKSFNDLRDFAKENITNPYKLDYFNRNIDIAERIRKENPDSTLKYIEFVKMEKRMMEEEDPI